MVTDERTVMPMNSLNDGVYFRKDGKVWNRFYVERIRPPIDESKVSLAG